MIGIGKLPLELRDDLVYFDFREPVSAVLPRDRAGRADLERTDTLANPAVIAGPIGPARRFDDMAGLRAQVGAEFAITGDISVVALIRHDDVAADAGSTLVAYGAQSGLEQLYTWRFYFIPQGGGQVVVGLGFTSNGAVSATPATIGVAAGWHLWTISRVRTRTGAVLRVHVDGAMVADSALAADLPPDAPTSGLLTVGYVEHLGNEQDNLTADIGLLKLFAREVTLEESQLYHAALTTDAKNAHALVSGTEPLHVDGGGVWSLDPSSWVRREIEVGADIWSVPLNGLRAVSDELPDRAYGASLARWEAILGLDAVYDAEERRRRVMAELARVRDFTPEEYRLALAEVLDTAPANVMILEHGSRYIYDDLSAKPDQWVVVGGGVTFGAALTLQATATSHFWPSTPQGVRQEVSTDGESFRAELVVDAISFPTDPEAYAGLLLSEPYGHRAVFFGVKNSQLVRTEYDPSTATWSADTILDASPSLPGVLGLRHAGAGAYTAWLANMVDERPVGDTWTSLLTEPRKAWLVLFGKTPGALTVGDSWAGTYARFTFRDGLEAYSWQVYRDATLGGSPDYNGAERIVRGSRPAHTDAHVTATSGLLLDDGNAALERSPMV